MLAGDYGSCTQRRAKALIAHRHEVWRHLPANLRHVLRALRHKDPAERPALGRKILDQALAGHYGTGVQKAAERIITRFTRWLR